MSQSAVRARPPHGVQQQREAERVVEGGVRGGPLRRSRVSRMAEQEVPALNEGLRLRHVFLGDGVLAEASRVAEQTAGPGGPGDGRQVSRGGEAG